MKKILLVIFSCFIISYLIYYAKFSENSKILFIGEKNISINNNKIKYYLYDKITYKELLKCIRNNDYYVVKEQKIYLTPLISSSKTIIINANQDEYNNRCKKKNINNYNYFVNKDLNDLLRLINKISLANIIVIENTCNKDIVHYNIDKNIKKTIFINKNKIYTYIN